MKIIEQTSGTIKLRDINYSKIFTVIYFIMAGVFFMFISPNVTGTLEPFANIKNELVFYFGGISLIFLCIYYVFKIRVVNMEITRHEINYSKKSLIKHIKRTIDSKNILKIVIRIIASGEDYTTETFLLLRDGEELFLKYGSYKTKEFANTIAIFLNVPLEDLPVIK